MPAFSIGKAPKGMSFRAILFIGKASVTTAMITPGPGTYAAVIRSNRTLPTWR